MFSFRAKFNTSQKSSAHDETKVESVNTAWEHFLKLFQCHHLHAKLSLKLSKKALVQYHSSCTYYPFWAGLLKRYYCQWIPCIDYHYLKTWCNKARYKIRCMFKSCRTMWRFVTRKCHVINFSRQNISRKEFVVKRNS